MAPKKPVPPARTRSPSPTGSPLSKRARGSAAVVPAAASPSYRGTYKDLERPTSLPSDAGTVRTPNQELDYFFGKLAGAWPKSISKVPPKAVGNKSKQIEPFDSANEQHKITGEIVGKFNRSHTPQLGIGYALFPSAGTSGYVAIDEPKVEKNAAGAENYAAVNLPSLTLRTQEKGKPVPLTTVGHEVMHVNDHQTDQMNAKIWEHIRDLAGRTNAQNLDDLDSSLEKLQNGIDPTGYFAGNEHKRGGTPGNNGYPFTASYFVHQFDNLPTADQPAYLDQLKAGKFPANSTELKRLLDDVINVTQTSADYPFLTNRVPPHASDPFTTKLSFPNPNFRFGHASEFPSWMSERLSHSWSSDINPTTVPIEEAGLADKILSEMDTAYPSTDYPTINHHVQARRGSLVNKYYTSRGATPPGAGAFTETRTYAPASGYTARRYP